MPFGSVVATGRKPPSSVPELSAGKTRSTRPRSFRGWAGGTSRSCRFRRWRRQRGRCGRVQSRRGGFSTPFLVSRWGSVPRRRAQVSCILTPRDHRVTLVMYTIKLPSTSGQGRDRWTRRRELRCKAARPPERYQENEMDHEKHSPTAAGCDRRRRVRAGGRGSGRRNGARAGADRTQDLRSGPRLFRRRLVLSARRRHPGETRVTRCSRRLSPGSASARIS